MKRNYGIDFLRIIAMIMVTVLHILGQGGVLSNAEPCSLKYWIVWFMEISCYCAVNCYALISGYGMSQASYKFSRILKLWLHTVFYTGLGVIVFLFFMPEAVGKRTIVYAIFPITNAQYWYISAYFGVLILAPLLNTVINHTEKRVFGATLAAAFAAFCMLPVVFQKNPYQLNEGYSLIWLCILYLAGGYMRKYDVVNKIKTSHAWITVLAMLAITFLTKFVLEQFFEGIPFLYSRRNAFISYDSPTMVLIAVGLLVICSKVHFTESSIKVIRLISPAALGVYLSHSSPLIWQNLMKGFAAFFVKHNCFNMVCLIICAILLIFTAGIVLDLIRIKLFALLKIDKLCSRLDAKLTRTQSKV